MSDSVNWQKLREYRSGPLPAIALLLVVAALAVASEIGLKGWEQSGFEVASHAGPDTEELEELRKQREQAREEEDIRKKSGQYLRPEISSFNLLLTTDTFADAHVGFAGQLSEQVAAFREIHARGDAAGLFQELVEHAGTPGQLYGLCGLHLTDRERFELEFAAFQQVDEYVKTFRGCIVDRTEIATILRLIERGDYPEHFAAP